MNRQTQVDTRLEEGSAYIITLMVLLILTVIGLSLTLITQTEVMVGSQERTVQRVFYSADSGIAVQTSLAMQHQHYQTIGYRVRDALELETGGTFDRDSVLRIVDEVEVSPLIPTLVAPCDGCEINESEYVRMVSYVRSTAERRGGPPTSGAEEIPLARKALLAYVDAQPLESKKHTAAGDNLPSKAAQFKID